MGVDTGLLIAGAAAAGLLGYALGHHHNYYGPAPYWGPTYYGRGYYGRGYYRGY